MGTLKSTLVRFSNELLIILLWGLALLLFAIIFTYSPNDPGWNTSSGSTVIQNIGGQAGAQVAHMGIYIFGFSVLLIPICIAQFAWNYSFKWKKRSDGQILLSILFFVGIVVAMVGGSGLENLYGSYSKPANFEYGGILGYAVTSAIAPYMEEKWTVLTFVGFFVIGTTAIGTIPWHRVLNITGRIFYALIRRMFVPPNARAFSVSKEKKDGFVDFQMKDASASKLKGTAKRSLFSRKKASSGVDKPSRKSSQKKEAASEKRRKEPVIVPIEESNLTSSDRRRHLSISQNSAKKNEPQEKQIEEPAVPEAEQSFPETKLLDPSNKYSHAYSEREIVAMGDKIAAMLQDFNVEVQVRKAHPGPVITQFEIEPAAGIKASQIVSLAADLARTLTVPSVRVVDNIPGSSFVGIEVPNKKREIVRLIDGLESDEYQSSDHPLTIVLGKDIRGNTVLSNLAAMPHLLIAGTTGAGKSVCLNAILLSFLFKSTTENLRLIMIDPKMLEFSIYEGIPQLLTPVITDMNKTENALRWCISEMERRFQLMAGLGVRNLDNLNETLRASKKPIYDPAAPNPELAKPLETLPYIVFVIDELADLIMVMGKKAEELIIRIVQRARAAGIHLIVATQRPSTDVIRGVLKANIPTRIGFKVASNADSRTILDQVGAENLLGAGDMLFLPPGSASMVRVHGAFVSDNEVKRVVDSVKYAGQPAYDESVTMVLGTESSLHLADGSPFGNGEDDELYNNAVDFVARSRRPTISSVQRHLRIGYNRAARIIESMEEAGVISAVQAGGKRAVLVPPPED